MENVVMTQMNAEARLEALLFAAGEPVTMNRLAQALGVSREVAEEAVERLRDHSVQSPERGLTVMVHDGSVELVTRPECGSLVASWTQSQGQESLSKAALEVLATIAYREPITRSAIEAIRGVNCQMTLRNLLLRGLIERRDEDVVRGYTYTLSAECLKHLGIQRREDLPEYERLSQDERLAALEQVSSVAE